jgi:glycosyltransferase involved in cell wall biosynthesis
VDDSGASWPFVIPHLQLLRMRASQQIYLANRIREQREWLEQVAAELAERRESISPLEARLIAHAGNLRLADVENALRHDVYLRRRRFGVLGRAAARARSWARPRIGHLRHYEARPLLVPTGYLAEAPPDPAPAISIVTPSYQQGGFIDRTLYSVVKQNYPALEYVVQDGGSSDETIDVLRRFEPLLTAWTSEPDEGQGDAINRGFAQTTGEIMAWLNSDDLLLPGALAHVARYFAEHPDVDVVYGNRIMIDENDSQIGAWILPAHDDVALTLADYVPQETLFWRRRIWDAAGGLVDPSFSFALDWDLLLRFRQAGAKIVRLPRFLGAFRVHAEQKTTVNDSVGRLECDRLRQRIHGRPLTIDEVLNGLRPYLVRHVLVHTRQRVVDRFPLARARVQTFPLEPGLRKPETELRSLASTRSSTEGAAVVSPLAPLADSVPLPVRGPVKG